MADIIIVGLAPGSSRFDEDTSPTRKRVRKWLGAANYDWTNKSDDDIELIKKYEKIIALGNVASDWLKKNNIEHLKIPHPSGLNRFWNEAGSESWAINNIRKYLQKQKSMV